MIPESASDDRSLTTVMTTAAVYASGRVKVAADPFAEQSTGLEVDFSLAAAAEEVANTSLKITTFDEKSISHIANRIKFKKKYLNYTHDVSPEDGCSAELLHEDE